MNETVYINWLLLISHFLWILGAAVMLASISIAIFVTHRQSSGKAGTFKEYIKNPTFQWAVWCSALLLLLGVVLFQFKLPSQNLVAVKVTPIANGKALMVMDDIPISLAPGALNIDTQNKSHPLNNKKMKNDTISLFWDGFVSTPFMHYTKGVYRFDFNARGTKADNEFAKIKVEFEASDRFNYLKTRKKVYITLNNNMNRYSVSFPITQNTIGRVRITYFNDVQMADSLKGRDVWLQGISITTIK